MHRRQQLQRGLQLRLRGRGRDSHLAAVADASLGVSSVLSGAGWFFHILSQANLNLDPGVTWQIDSGYASHLKTKLQVSSQM